jgi:putative hydrolase of the HAD superfamily
MNAVVLDLFGTLVAAPTPTERSRAAMRLARVIGCEPAAVERYFLVSWRARHDGTLPDAPALAEHLLNAVNGPTSTLGLVIDELCVLSRPRLVPETSVLATLRTLQRTGYRLGVLSDASPDIAAAWPSSPLAPVVDTVAFSCSVGCTKPDQRLYSHISGALGVSAGQALYCGDGGGDELAGAVEAGMRAVGVRRRGGVDALAYGDTPWHGLVLDAVEQLPAYLAGPR